MNIGCIIQANRYGWDGTEDYCIRELDNKYLIEHVIEKIKFDTNIREIVIAVPDIDSNYIFKNIAEKYGIKCYVGSLNNVLDRFINASKEINCDIIVKTLGQNCFLDTTLLNNMLDFMIKNQEIDFLQTPDDFETKFTAEIFKPELLITVKEHFNQLDEKTKQQYLARPMSYIKINKSLFNLKVYENTPKYSNAYQMIIREKAKQIYNEGDRTDTDTNYQVEHGNFFLQRYEFSKKYIKQNDSVLDIACGSGFGTKDIYNAITKSIIGADLNKDAIQNNRVSYPDIDFQVQDATKTTFTNNQFDVVLSMETFEHIPLDLLDNYLREMKRILKMNGTFICTTPQNNNGEIPLVPWHIKEYSLKEFKDILSRFFYLEKIYGSRNGVYTDDEVGNGMMAICKKVK